MFIFYKHILGLLVVFSELELISREYYQSFVNIFVKPCIEELDMYFEMTEDKLGILEIKTFV
jgi:hypothetical protein